MVGQPCKILEIEEEGCTDKFGLGHRHAHDRRQEVDVTTTIVIPEVVVYVDEDANVLGSATKIFFFYYTATT